MSQSYEKKFIGRRIVNAYLSSVTSITLVLLLVGISAMLLINTRMISTYFRENLKFTVMLKTEISDSRAKALQAELQSWKDITSSVFISREQGAKELSEILGQDFLDVFETAPIPVSIDVTLSEEVIRGGTVEAVKSSLESLPEVEEVVYQKSLVDTLNSNLNKISIILGALIVILVCISFVLISNTVRLNVYARRFTIRTMSLVGATRHFIRKPFMVQGLFQGLYAALLATLLLVWGLFFLRRSLPALAGVFTPDLLLKVIAVIVGSGILLCLVSTLLVVNKLLRSKTDDLYY